MGQNFGNFSMEEAMRLAQTPAGQQLLTLLQQNSAARQAAGQAAAGDYQAVRESLAPLLKDPQFAALLRQMGG